jgi:hypothetical protein
LIPCASCHLVFADDFWVSGGAVFGDDF